MSVPDDLDMTDTPDDDVTRRVNQIRKWFRSESHGPTFKCTRTVSSWYLDSESAEQVGKAYVGVGRWNSFSIKAMYSLDEPA